MARLRISGKEYDAPVIEIEGGHLIVGDIDMGPIGYECCIKVLDVNTVKTINEQGHFRWETV
jgi:hypothetical protein